MIKPKSLFLCLAILMYVAAYPQDASFDRPAFYRAMKSNEVSLIDQQLGLLKGSSFHEKEAFEGALLMKKSGIVTAKIEKLNLFKNGKAKLEKALSEDGQQTEYHFLRLMIQENAPKFLGYHDDVDADCQYIRTHFKNLAGPVQKEVTDYSRKPGCLGTLK